MVRALRVALFAYGVMLLIMGLVGILFPDQMSEMVGIAEVTDNIIYLVMIISIISISIGIWLIIAGRDPLSNIYWVKFVITKTVLSVVVEVYLILQGYVDFNQVDVAIILDGVFAVAFLALYPWRAARISD